MSFNLFDFLMSLLDLTVADYLRAVWGEHLWVEILLDLVGMVILATFALVSIFFWGWLERKVLARFQDRIGPNRVGGRYGMLQMVADVLKMLTKEIIIPSGADKLTYILAPILSVAAFLLVLAVMPFAPGVIGADLNVGVVYIAAISSISVMAFIFAGWGSNNKYALLGAFRAVAQLVSYEVPMILAMLVPALLASSLSTVSLVEAQTIPFFFVAPLAGLIFFISALAETGRTPFDLLEAESEIVAGYHTEYGGMNIGMFLAAEYGGAVFMSALFVTLYWGGYRLFGLEDITLASGFQLGRLLGLIILFMKTFLAFFLFMWVRATLPRFRIDQLLSFNWKTLVPMAFALLTVVAIIDKALPADTPALLRAGTQLAGNLVIGLAVLELARRWARKQRQAQELATSQVAAATRQRLSHLS